MAYEVRLQSTDPGRPNEALLQQILDRQSELSEFLKEDDSTVKGAEVEPPAAFPTGLETFVILVAVSFVTGIATGIAKGAGGEIGNAIGKEAGKRIGARIRQWIKREFPDVVIEDVSER